jgi:hypothetical protein
VLEKALKKDWSERLEEDENFDRAAAGTLIYTNVRIYSYDLIYPLPLVENFGSSDGVRSMNSGILAGGSAPYLARLQ